MGSIEHRLQALERQAFAGPDGGGAWAFEEQVAHLLEALIAHSITQSSYPATDREIDILGALHALYRLPGGVGEMRLPSGAVVSLAEGEDGDLDIELAGQVCLEDLPGEVRERVHRMDPAEQPARERWLYENCSDPPEKGRPLLEKYASVAVSMVRGGDM